MVTFLGNLAYPYAPFPVASTATPTTVCSADSTFYRPVNMRIITIKGRIGYLGEYSESVLASVLK